jgi:hypothetical protein
VTRRNDVFFPTDAKGISSLQHDLSKVAAFARTSGAVFRVSFFLSGFLSGAAREPARFFENATAFFFRDERPFDEPDVASASAEAPPLSRETRVVSRAPE